MNHALDRQHRILKFAENLRHLINGDLLDARVARRHRRQAAQDEPIAELAVGRRFVHRHLTVALGQRHAELGENLVDPLLLRHRHIEAEIGADVDLVRLLQLPDANLPLRLVDGRLQRAVARLHIVGGDQQVDAFARLDVGGVIEDDVDLHIALLRLDVEELAAAPLGLLDALDVVEGDEAELLENVAQLLRLLRRDLDLQHRFELPGRVLLQLRLGDAPLLLGNRFQGVDVGLLDILDLDAHADALGDDEGGRGLNFLLGQGDGDGTQGNLVAKIADFAFHLLDLGAPDPQLALGEDEVLDFAFAGLDDVEQAFFHGAGGAESAFEIGILLGDIEAAEPLVLHLAAFFEFAAQIAQELVEKLRRHAHDDGAAHLAVGQLIAVDGGDEAALDAADEATDADDRFVERFDLELHFAGADDLAAGVDGGLGRFGRRLLGGDIAKKHGGWRICQRTGLARSIWPRTVFSLSPNISRLFEGLAKVLFCDGPLGHIVV